MISPVSQSTVDAANAIRDQAEAEYARIRSDGRYTNDAIRAQLAVVYSKARDSMALLQATVGDQTENARLSTLQAAFGIEDLIPSYGSRAEVGISYRDAQDRVATVDTADEAMTLLQRATEQGDELLARAIARQAWDHVSLGDTYWQGVLDSYAATRPKVQGAVANLASLLTRKLTAIDMFAFVLPAPSELAGLHPFQVDQLAAGA
jgi:hypothetical protein